MSAEPPRREREVIRERPVEREVVRDGGNPFGVVAAIIGVIVLLLLVWLLFFNGGEEIDVAPPEGDTTDVEADVDIDAGDGGDGEEGGDEGDGGDS